MKTKQDFVKPKKFVTVQKSSKYGQLLYGLKIYYEGKKPSGLSKDGKIQFGKHVLEMLQNKFKSSFRLVISKEKNNVEKVRGVLWIYISQDIFKKMSSALYDKGRDIKIDIARHYLGNLFPGYFKSNDTQPYVPGTIARVIGKASVGKMSGDDKKAIEQILPEFIASESLKSVNLLKAVSQIKSLKELEFELREAIDQGHSESWWQTYIKERILIIQQGYIQAINKLNVAIGKTKFPDFILVSHDDYVDILEIKKPDTQLLKHDTGRDNYYWDTEMSKAISQTENYISEVEKSGNDLRAYLKDKYTLDLQVLRPRGIILAGKSKQILNQKEKDDFRLLSHGLKNISIVTYDELLIRLSNYIRVLESHIPKKQLRD